MAVVVEPGQHAAAQGEEKIHRLRESGKQECDNQVLLLNVCWVEVLNLLEDVDLKFCGLAVFIDIFDHFQCNHLITGKEEDFFIVRKS